MSESVSAQLCSAVLRPRFGRAAMLRSSAPRAAHGCGSADSAPGDENQKTVQGTQEHRANRCQAKVTMATSEVFWCCDCCDVKRYCGMPGMLW